MSNRLDVMPAEIELLNNLLKRYLPNVTVWAYGSRVTGKARPASDLDLVVFASKAKIAALSELREAFEESALPFRVDLFVWDQIPESFKDNILECFVVLQRGEEPVGESSYVDD